MEAKGKTIGKPLEGPVFGVEWLESEAGWGQRPEGWRLFTDLEQCEQETRKASKNGPYSGGYLGPARPLCCYEIPIEGLDKGYLEELEDKGRVHTSNYWKPQYRGRRHDIS
jgi:hypothetical protein